MNQLKMKWVKEPKPAVLSVEERWEQGREHNPKSVELYKALAKLDEANGDCFDFKSGGDGDNGEHLMYLLDIWFETNNPVLE